DASSGVPVDLAVYRYDQVTYGAENPFGDVAAQIYAGDYRSKLSVGSDQVPVHQATFDAVAYPTPADASQTGCGWPAADTWQVPDDLASGIFIAHLSRGTDESWVLFVVRPATPGASSRILCQLSVNTYQAYNPWLGGSFYGPPISD